MHLQNSHSSYFSQALKLVGPARSGTPFRESEGERWIFLCSLRYMANQDLHS